MSKIKIQGDGGGMGTFTIISPNTDSSNTITLPDTSGTLVTSSQSIVPTSDSVYDLGSPTFKWKDLYLSGNTINIGGQTISASATGIVLPQLTIGSGSGSVNLSASASGKLEQTGTSSTGALVPSANIPTELNDLSDVDLSVEPTDNQTLKFAITKTGLLSTVTIPTQSSSASATGNGVVSLVDNIGPRPEYTSFTSWSQNNWFPPGAAIWETTGSNPGVYADPDQNRTIGIYRNLATTTNSVNGTGATVTVIVYDYAADIAALGQTFTGNDPIRTIVVRSNEYLPDESEWVSPPSNPRAHDSANWQHYSTGNTAGSGYATGDTITVSGSLLGGGADIDLDVIGVLPYLVPGTYTKDNAEVLRRNSEGILSSLNQNAHGGIVGTYNITVDNTGTPSSVEIVSGGSNNIVGDYLYFETGNPASVPDGIPTLGIWQSAGGLGGFGQTSPVAFRIAQTDGGNRTSGTYSGVTGTSSNSSSTVGTFDIIVDSSGDLTSATPVTFGFDNAVGDVITILDSDLGNGGAVDAILNVETITESGVFSPVNAILEFSDFADVDTVTSPPTNSEVLSWDDTNNNWSPSPNGMPYVVSNVTELLALTNSYTLVGGQKALVTDTNRIYQYTGSAPNSNWRHAVSGWYALASITMSNGKPAAVTGTNAAYTLDDLGESIIVTTTVADPEQFPTEWSFEFDTDPAPNTTVTQEYLTTLDGVSNVFTITPGIHPWDSATFNVTFKAKDDSLDTTDATSEFTLTINVPDWENNANWNSAISNLDFNATDSASMNGISASFYGQSVDVDDRGETIIISDPYYAAPIPGTTGVNAVGAIHIYNKNTIQTSTIWTKNSQTLVDPIDAAGATGGDGNPVSVTNIGGFAGNRGTVDDMSTGDQIALSSDGKTIVSMYGNGANTRAPTFNFDSVTSTYLAADSLYLTDVLDQSGNQDGIYLGPNNTLGQTVLGTQPKLAISKDGNTCILGYGMEGPKGMKFTYGDPRTDHPLISPHGSLDFPEFGHDRHATVNNFGEGASTGQIVTVDTFVQSPEVGNGPTPTGRIVEIDQTLDVNLQPDANRTEGIYHAITGTSNGTGTMTTVTIYVNSDGSYRFPPTANFGDIGHEVGDTITFPDSIVGNGGAPDIIVTVLATDKRIAGTYTGVTGTSSGTGTVGTFDVVVGANGTVTSVTPITRGTGHVVGDVITIADADVGGVGSGYNSMGGIGDFTMNVATIDQTSNRVAGTYTGVTGTSSGSGVVGKFNVTVETGGNVSNVTVTNAGYGHTVGDIITITDADLGGGIAPDLTVTVATIESTDIVSSGGTVNDFIDTDVITDTNGARASLDVGQVNYGAAYIFEKTGTGTNTGTPLWNSTNSEWGLTKKISGVNIVDTLGASVDLSADGTVAIASAPRGTVDINSLTTTANGGYVTVFDSTTTNGTWTQVTTLRPPANIIDNSIVDTGMHKYVNSLGAPDVSRTMGTYTNVTGTSSGSGSIGHFNITVDALGGVSVENTASLGSGNSIGDIITIADADLGGGGAADFTMTITNLTGINAQSKRSKFGGSSISISGDGYTIAVGDLGSANENPLATSATLSTHPFVSGCVHIYKKIAGTWTYIETLLSPSGTSQDGFGSGVDLNLNGMVLTVGSINESSLKKNVDGPPNTMLSNSGSMYTFISQDTGNYFLSTGDNTTIGNYKQVKKENILPFENSNTGSLMGRPKITADGKTIVSGHKSLETNNNSGRVEIWTEGETNTLGEIIGLNSTYSLNTDGTSTVIDVTFTDLPTNEIWWSFATSNVNSNITGGTWQPVIEKRHATPFDISKSQTDEISEFSSGNWTPVDNSTMNNFSIADALRTAGTYSSVTGTSSGTGTVGTFDITVDANGDVTDVTVVTLGVGHVVGDTITISDSDLGTGGAADFTMDVATISSIAVVRRLFGNTNRPRSFKMESLDNVGTANPITTDFDYVALNTTAGFTNPTGTGPENTFIITPNSDITLGGSFDLTITATDGVNTKTATTTLTLPV